MLAQPHYANGTMPGKNGQGPQDSDTLTLRLSTRQILAILGGIGTLLMAIVGAGWLAIPATVNRVDEGVKALQVSVGQLSTSTQKLADAVEGLQGVIAEMQRQGGGSPAPRPARPRPRPQPPAPPKPAAGLFGF